MSKSRPSFALVASPANWSINLESGALKATEMRVLGIDPGMAAMGYGLVEGSADCTAVVDYGVLTTSPGAPATERLKKLYLALTSILARYQPQEVAIELFVARSLRSALMVGQARGIAILAAANSSLPVYEYSPLQVKRSVAGYGRSQKEQVQEMVRLQLGMEFIPQPDDAADALAVAICHLRQRRVAILLAQQGQE